MSGWLPVEAMDSLEAETDKASGEEADRLLALPPAERALVLMERARHRTAEPADFPLLRPADLARVLAGFGAGALPEAEELAERLPGLVRAAEPPIS